MAKIRNLSRSRKIPLEGITVLPVSQTRRFGDLSDSILKEKLINNATNGNRIGLEFMI
jgi:hypothetical protein